MGYDTRFNGSINLSRKLTFKEAKQILDWNDVNGSELPRQYHDNPPISEPVLNSWMQWVPSRTLQSIVHDGGEKFYDYDLWMVWIVNYLKSIGITCNGLILWCDDYDCSGKIEVVDSVVIDKEDKKPNVYSDAPLTKEKLTEMILNSIED